MIKYSYLSRRKFLNYFQLIFVFLLASCTKGSKTIFIGFQQSFIPESFKKILPRSWDKKNINFKNIFNNKNSFKYKKIDYLLINDGWINRLKFDDFKDLDSELFSKLDGKSKNYLKSFDINLKNKFFPVGVIPYGVIIKNKSGIQDIARQSWQFLLSRNLKGRILFPNSPRIILSIAKKLDDKQALNKLIDQQNIYDDKNALDWILNSKVSVAVMPYFLCQRILKIDSRFSLVFPREGVPLIWQFISCKTNIDQKYLFDWINSFNNINVAKKLLKDGWYLPFKDKNLQDLYRSYTDINKRLPSNECWENSWSLSPLNEIEKAKEEFLWKSLLSP